LEQQSQAGEPIIWVVTQSGQLRIAPATQGGVRITHAVVAGGQPVIAAGQAQVAVGGGRTIGLEINSQSGHYFENQPTAASQQSDAIGRAAFEISAGITFPR
jgi:hypothetical protein